MFVQKNQNHRGIKIEKLDKLDLKSPGSFVQEFVDDPFLSKKFKLTCSKSRWKNKRDDHYVSSYILLFYYLRCSKAMLSWHHFACSCILVGREVNTIVIKKRGRVKGKSSQVKNGHGNREYWEIVRERVVLPCFMFYGSFHQAKTSLLGIQCLGFEWLLNICS